MLLLIPWSSIALTKQLASHTREGTAFLASLFPHKVWPGGVCRTGTHHSWMLLPLFPISLLCNQSPCPPPGFSHSAVTNQGFPTPRRLSTDLCTKLLLYLEREKKSKLLGGKGLPLLEVCADSLELWGRHQKLIVLEGDARLLPFPDLISRLCNEGRIRGTFKTGKGETKFHHQSNPQILKVPFLSVPREGSISLE